MRKIFKKKKNPLKTGKYYRCNQVICHSEQFCKDDLTVERAKEIIEEIVDSLIWLYENEYGHFIKDWRSGAETYGYDSDEEILANLSYISDRWGGAFRIRWMIDLVRPDYIPNKNRRRINNEF